MTIKRTTMLDKNFVILLNTIREVTTNIGIPDHKITAVINNLDFVTTRRCKNGPGQYLNIAQRLVEMKS